MEGAMMAGTIYPHDNPRSRTMSEDDVRVIAAAAAREAVHETLKTLGVDPGTPFEMQRDFQHLRSWRQSVEAVKRQGFITVCIVLVTGVLGLIGVALTKSP